VKKINLLIVIILISSIIGCTSKNNIENKFDIENIDKGVLTYSNGEIFYHKIFSYYNIKNIGETKSKNAILKINIYLNNIVIYQEIIEIKNLNANENITKKMTFNYDKHNRDNFYKIVAEILIDYNQICFLEDIIRS
jgi:hypothetical protein